MTKPPKKLNNLGRVSKPHGLQGYFYFKVPSSLQAGHKVFLGQTPENTKEVVIKDVKIHGKRTLLKLSIAKDRTELEKHVGSFLWLPEQKKKTSDTADEQSSHIGKEVSDSEGLQIGLCVDFYDYGAGTIIVIENPLGMTLDIPFNETYFKKPGTLITNFPKTFFDDLWQKI